MILYLNTLANYLINDTHLQFNQTLLSTCSQLLGLSKKLDYVAHLHNQGQLQQASEHLLAIEWPNDGRTVVAVESLRQRSKQYHQQLLDTIHEGTDIDLVAAASEDQDYTLTCVVSLADGNGSFTKQELAISLAVKVLTNLDTALAFLFHHIFNGSRNLQELQRLYGHMVLPDTFEQLIINVIEPAVPSAAASATLFDTLSSMASTATGLEKKWLSEYTGVSSPLDISIAKYVSQFDQHMAQRRKNKLVDSARQVMLRKIYDAEWDDTEQLKLTQTPRVIWAMVQEIMNEAEQLQQQTQEAATYPCTLAALQKSVKDIIEMYLAIMPSVHRCVLLQHSTNSMVFYNDCHWLANRIDQSLPDTLNPSVRQLRQLGNYWQFMVVSRPLNNTAALLHRVWEQKQKQRERIQGIETSPRGSIDSENTRPSLSLDEVIQLAIDQIEKLAAIIVEVVTNETYHATIVQLVDGLLSRLIQDILSMDDIGADESHTIASAFNTVAQLSNVAYWKNADTTPSEMQLRQWLHHWQMFWMLKDMLDMTMNDILEALQRGSLCMFTHEQLVHLVCALFADSPRRDDTIMTIQASDLQKQQPDGLVSTDLGRNLTMKRANSPADEGTLSSSGSLGYAVESVRSPDTSQRWNLDQNVTGDTTWWNEDNWSNEDDTTSPNEITVEVAGNFTESMDDSYLGLTQTCAKDQEIQKLQQNESDQPCQPFLETCDKLEPVYQSQNIAEHETDFLNENDGWYVDEDVLGVDDTPKTQSCAVQTSADVDETSIGPELQTRLATNDYQSIVHVDKTDNHLPGFNNVTNHNLIEATNQATSQSDLRDDVSESPSDPSISLMTMNQVSDDVMTSRLLQHNDDTIFDNWSDGSGSLSQPTEFPVEMAESGVGSTGGAVLSCTLKHEYQCQSEYEDDLANQQQNVGELETMDLIPSLDSLSYERTTPSTAQTNAQGYDEFSGAASTTSVSDVPLTQQQAYITSTAPSLQASEPSDTTNRWQFDIEDTNEGWNQDGWSEDEDVLQLDLDSPMATTHQPLDNNSPASNTLANLPHNNFIIATDDNAEWEQEGWSDGEDFSSLLNNALTGAQHSD
ncbi:hypothetical protein DM01DRAFT_1386875 [Hesseltinella vesiculosa]|uniref:Retrograde transport protein Dsl1 C-terminal domain-containing protein n=1 Tax=Hesseltinella vesiculosa TaxID=101127 RepID=A0A1X2G464_9FUNG|nr:hypothetical protein DM01DRAFT_1386875 [Hesseltinella vesiculosa]